MAIEHHSLPFSIGIEAAGFLLAASAALCHELGHAIAARACSILIRRFVFGAGRLLLHWRWGITDFELRLFPFTGYVLTYPILPSRKRARMILSGGGAVTNLAIAGVILALIGPALLTRSGSAVILLAQITVTMQLIYAVLTLAPREYGGRGPVRMSDGLTLWRIAAEPKPDMAAITAGYLARLRAYGPIEDSQAMRSPTAATVIRWLARPDRAADRALHDLHEEQVERLRSRGMLSVAEEMIVLDGRLTVALATCDETPPQQLDEASRRLVALGPSSGAALETRASVLIQLGEYDEGKRMLEQLTPTESAYAAVLRLLFLAQAEHGLGNPATARARLAEAHEITNRSPFSAWPRPLIARIDALLAGMPAEAATRTIVPATPP
jgi:hypothetical protein